MANTLQLKDFPLICRACLCKGPNDKFVSLAMEPGRGTFIKSTHIYVDKDQLPMRLCRVCFQKCTDWLKFLTMATENDRLFHSMTKSKSAKKRKNVSEDVFADFRADTNDDTSMDDYGDSSSARNYDFSPTQMINEELGDEMEGLNNAPTANATASEDEPVIVCPVTECGIQLIGCKDFEQHCIKIHVQKNDIICPVCDLRYKLMDNLKNHIYLHTNVKFDCPKCEKQLPSPKVLKDHMRDAHKVYIGVGREPPQQQDEKPLLLSDPLDAVGIGIKIQDEEEEQDGSQDYGAGYLKSLKPVPVDCPVCKCTLNTPCNFDKHIGTHLSQLSKRCPVCKKKFMSEYNLKYHLYSHTEITFACTSCRPKPRIFVNPKSYSDHVREAHPSAVVKPFNSCKICGKVFKQQVTLREHLKWHSAGEKFSCSDCGMSFQQKEMLEIHVAQKHNSRTAAECALCSEPMRSKDELRDHMLSEHHGTELMCDLCGSLFKSNDQLLSHKHLKCVHKIEKD